MALDFFMITSSIISDMPETILLLCKVVKLSMQCCGKLLLDSFETYKTFLRPVNLEFEHKFDV